MKDAPNGIRVLIAVAVVMTVGGSLAWALPGTNARFSSKCKPSHTEKDDPIVYPRKPGWSHKHQFFGARTTDAFSTARKLRGAPSSCAEAGDSAAYWVPTLEVGRQTARPKLAQAYYDAGGKRRDLVRAFPPGLQMIAGRAGAERPQATRKVAWYCLGPPGEVGRDGNLIEKGIFQAAHQYDPVAHPYCADDRASLSMLVRFPDCWDGRRLDSENHRSHVAYSSRERKTRYARCPATHPVPVPRIVLAVHYPTRGKANPRRIELSSGGVFSGHADFINSWDQSALENLVRRCINLALC